MRPLVTLHGLTATRQQHKQTASSKQVGNTSHSGVLLEKGQNIGWFSQYSWSGDEDDGPLYSPVSPDQDSEMEDEYDDVADVGSTWSSWKGSGLEITSKTATETNQNKIFCFPEWIKSN